MGLYNKPIKEKEIEWLCKHKSQDNRKVGNENVTREENTLSFKGVGTILFLKLGNGYTIVLIMLFEKY